MSTTVEIPAGAQPRETPGQGGDTAPEAATAPQTVEEWNSALDSMTPEQISELVSLPAASLPPAPNEPEVIATPAAREPAAATPPTAEPSPALDRPRGAPSRIRLNGVDEEDAARVTQYIDAIRSGKSREEAAAIFAPPIPATPAQAIPSPAQPVPAPVPAAPVVPPPAVAEIDARLAEAEQTLAEAQASYDAVEISKATIALTDLKIERFTALAAQQQQSAVTADYDRTFDSTVADLIASYPDLKDEASPLAVRLEELRDLETVRNPGFDNDPTFLARLASQAARDVAIQPVAQPAQNTQQHRPRMGAVAPAGATVSKAMTKEEAERSFDSVLAGMTPEQQGEFLLNALNIPG